MNLLDLLTYKEQCILFPVLYGFSVREVSIINLCAIDEVHKYRKSIIEKFDKYCRIELRRRGGTIDYY